MKRMLLLAACSMLFAACGDSVDVSTEHHHSMAKRRVKIEIITLASSHSQDPCFDFWDLHAGRGAPERQHWFNHLRTDGGEPDYLRYWAACTPNGRQVIPTESAYWCAHRLLDGEHGHKPWSPTRPGLGNAYGIPQADPGHKMASHGSDWSWNGRTQIRWFIDYVHGRYRVIWNTPKPCQAGY